MGFVSLFELPRRVLLQAPGYESNCFIHFWPADPTYCQHVPTFDIWQVAERASSTSAMLVDEGRQLLDERAGGGGQQRRQGNSPGGALSGSSHQHVSSAGLARRKPDATDGLQLAAMGASGGSVPVASAMGKDD